MEESFFLEVQIKDITCYQQAEKESLAIRLKHNFLIMMIMLSVVDTVT